LSAGCALAGVGTWKVPNRCPIVSGQGAVKEWIGKTWGGYVHGMCVSSNAIYLWRKPKAKDGKFSDITRYGVLDKQIER
jgi:hypothetical protein